MFRPFEAIPTRLNHWFLARESPTNIIRLFRILSLKLDALNLEMFSRDKLSYSPVIFPFLELTYLSKLQSRGCHRKFRNAKRFLP